MRVCIVVRRDIGMEKIEVDTLQPHDLERVVERCFEPRCHLACGRRTKTALARNPNALRESTVEGLANNRLARAVERCGVDQIDAGIDCFTQCGDRLFPRCLAPDKANASAAQGEPADLTERSELCLVHGDLLWLRTMFRTPVLRKS